MHLLFSLYAEVWSDLINKDFSVFRSFLCPWILQ